jgi:hypothetical protein
MKIGKDLTITHYSTKQKGYGRQGLYIEFAEIGGLHYIKDVFPNVKEHFDILLTDEAFYNENKKCYTDCSGNGEYQESELYDSVLDALNAKLKGNEIEILEEEEN